VYEFRQVAAIYPVAAQPQVIDPPRSQILPQGANATFFCITIGRVRWEIILPHPRLMLAVDYPLSDTELINFAAWGIYATGTLVNSSITEYLSTLTLTTDERNVTEVYCRARLNFRITAPSQPAAVILYGECAD